MSAALVSLAAEIGAPLIKDILARKIGSANAELAETVVQRIAGRVGVKPDKLEAEAKARPGRVQEAMKEVERMSPELIALYAQGLEGQFTLLQAEREDPAWMRAWRPLGMYGLGALWFWNLIVLHVLNAIFTIALPQIDLYILLQLTGLYLGLYMGGHTVKDVVGKWAGRRSNA